MKSLLQFLLCLGLGLAAYSAHADGTYQTFCEIKDGKAIGSVASPRYESLTVSGDVKFRFFDSSGSEVGTDHTYEYEYIYNDLEVVSEVSAPSGAVRCSFDISDAVSSGSTQNPPPSTAGYSTSCEIREGRAHGFVSSPRYESITVSGNVSFIFYDEDGDEIDRESTYEYEYIYNDTEEVSDTSAPTDAVHCAFDVSGAVN